MHYNTKQRTPAKESVWHTNCHSTGSDLSHFVTCHRNIFGIVCFHSGEARLKCEIMIQPTKRKKKVDYEALQSPLMRIPRMNVEAARNLLDLGIRDIFELKGRAPEVLFEEASRKTSGIPADRIRFFRMAVYYAENEKPDPHRLHPDQWQ